MSRLIHLRFTMRNKEKMKVTEEHVLPSLALLPLAAVVVGALVIAVMAILT